MREHRWETPSPLTFDEVMQSNRSVSSGWAHACPSRKRGDLLYRGVGG